MRRGRDLREYRDAQLRHKKVQTLAERRKAARDKLVNKKKEKVIIVTPEKVKNPRRPDDAIVIENLALKESGKDHKRIMARSQRNRSRQQQRQPNYAKLSSIPASSPIDFSFVPYSEYKYSFSRPVNVCHIIESLGLGGAQTMMLELIKGLTSYFGDHINNFVICVHPKIQSPSKRMYGSYGVIPEWVSTNNLRSYLESNNIDIVLHHRIAVSRCLRNSIPKTAKYILLNHTWNSLIRMNQFMQCDLYVSVCQFLHNQTRWEMGIHPSRRLVILNGIENNYIDTLSVEDNFRSNESFITGRCHRLISPKFKVDSLSWMNHSIVPSIPGFSHHIIGAHKDVQILSSKYKWLKYHGPIVDLQKKMSIIKQFDIYFYETFGHEGASVAVLESLACGIPVLAKKLGGTEEIIKDGINGYLCKDRNIFSALLYNLAKKPNILIDLKQKTIDDFNNRLHVKNTACKYMQLFELLMK